MVFVDYLVFKISVQYGIRNLTVQ